MTDGVMEKYNLAKEEMLKLSANANKKYTISKIVFDEIEKRNLQEKAYQAFKTYLLHLDRCWFRESADVRSNNEHIHQLKEELRNILESKINEKDIETLLHCLSDGILKNLVTKQILENKHSAYIKTGFIRFKNTFNGKRHI